MLRDYTACQLHVVLTAIVVAVALALVEVVEGLVLKAVYIVNYCS
jgi:hypothetical protein